MQLLATESECDRLVRPRLISGEPFFLGRIGGSDTSAVAAYNAGRISLETPAARNGLADYKVHVETYNGYYDMDNDDEKFVSYLDLMLSSYKKCSETFFVCRELVSMYFPERMGDEPKLDELVEKEYLKLMNQIIKSQPDLIAMPYNYVELVMSGPSTLFRLFSSTLPGKKVLVISPFSESIMSNYVNRQHFFKEYNYPDFRLSTYSTPITYRNLPQNLYPHKDWFSTLDAMQHDISKLDFDIAFLSCGSYAPPLGVFIRDVLGKQAIYLGGIMQLYFGIMGRRYDNDFINYQINPNSFIRPLESAVYMPHISLSNDAPAEAFGAYF